MSVKTMKILVLGSYGPSLMNFRGPLLRELVERGHQVTGVAAGVDAELGSRLREIGVTAVEAPLARTGMNPIADLIYFRALLKLFRTSRPDVLVAYTAKPVIWGILAARAAGVPRVVALITGLGYAFSDPDRASLRHATANLAARLLYRLALPRADYVLFQNPDDQALFQSYGFTPPADRVGVTAGSGIDLERFAPAPAPRQPSFLMLARLLGAKGVREYATAVRALKQKHPKVEFRLGGPIDAGPDAVSQAELDAAIASGVTYLGNLDDVRPALAAAGVYVLPSYYREGTPRSVLEALAVGRAVITTDAPGCRETVVDGVNGLLIPPRDAQALEAAMERFILEPELIHSMGQMSLDLARSKYDVRKVNAQVLQALTPEPFDSACSDGI